MSAAVFYRPCAAMRDCDLAERLRRHHCDFHLIFSVHRPRCRCRLFRTRFMLNTARATHAMAVAPHHLASQSALAVMREGGNAVEAMIAAAATIATVYPHMNGIGGDSFWLIVPPDGAPVAIDACGSAAQGATIAAYRERGLSAIPIRGP